MRKIVINESLVLFKGRLRFKLYIPSKRLRFSIKMFILRDCETGIILNILIHTEQKDLADEYLGVTGGIIKILMKNYLRKGHLLY